jgi:hypothetical protein
VARLFSQRRDVHAGDDCLVACVASDLEAQIVHAMQSGALPDVEAQLSAAETSAAFQAAGFKNSGGQW